MKTSGTVQRTQIGIHTATATLFLTKVPKKTYDGEKKTSSTNVAGKLKLDPYMLHCIVSTKSG
jgi:hypothetical protein